MIDNEKEWLTISEASKMAGVSPQTIYKRLSTSLKPYVKEVDNKKYLNIKGLDYVGIIRFNQPTKKKKVESKVELNVEIVKTLDILRDQLKEKDKQLETKDKQLETKDTQIQELNNRLEQSLKANLQNNFLMAQKEENHKMLEDPGTKKKRSFFQRLFKR